MIMPLKDRPVCLVLTRQNLPTLDRSKYAPAAGVARGAYVLADADGGKPDLILIGTGSELSLCVEAYEQLKQQGIESPRGQHAVVGVVRAAGRGLSRSGVARRRHARAWRSKPASSRAGRSISARGGRFIGMKSTGHRLRAAVLSKHFGFTAENVLKTAKELLGKK